jgi:hypothetical protein
MKALILAALLLTGCATVHTLPELSLDQRIVLAVKSVDDVIATAVQARQAGMIDDALYLKLDPVIDSARDAATVAAGLVGTPDGTDKEQQLQLLDSLLWKINSLLPEESNRNECNGYHKPDYCTRITSNQAPAIAA